MFISTFKKILNTIFNTICNAVFPRSQAEIESLSYTPAEALIKLPPAPNLPPEISSYCYSVFAYKEPRVSQLVWNIKYKKSQTAVAIGGWALLDKIKQIISRESKPFQLQKYVTSISSDILMLMGQSPINLNFSTSVFPNIILIPIPITHRRKNERGYNQCELLVDEIARLIKSREENQNFMKEKNDINYNTLINTRIIVRKDILERIHHLSRQTLKNRADRLESAKGIFQVKNNLINTNICKQAISDIDNNYLNNSLFIVIDDVITTGSTISEAISTLKNAGFKNVIGLSLAH